MKDSADHNLNICLAGKDACCLFTEPARTERWVMHLATAVVSVGAYLTYKKNEFASFSLKISEAILK